MSDNNKEIKKLKKKITELEKQSKEYLNGWKRAKADYLNLEQSSQNEKNNWIRFSNSQLILQLLQVLDSFDQSIENMPKNLKSNSWAKGIIHIKKQFEQFLKDQGIEKIKTIGQEFNPEFHEVVAKKGDKQKIVQEVQAGYTMNGNAIRTAKVIIK